jgi:DNA polymerase-3 subunit epsilon
MEIIIIVGLLAAIYWYYDIKEKSQPTKNRSSSSARNSNRSRGKAAKQDPLKGFVVVDVETTGLHAAKNKIIEIAAIKILDLNAKEHDTIQHLIKIKGKVPQRIVEITGITDSMLKDGVDIETAIKNLKDFCGDLPLVAYNADFDKGFLVAAANTVPIEINNEFHCALLMARKAFPGHSSYKLTAIAEHAGIETDGAHRAMQDCVMTVHVYDAALRKLGKAIAI